MEEGERDREEAWSEWEVPVTSHEALTNHCPVQSIIILSPEFSSITGLFFFDFVNVNESFRFQIPGVSRGFVLGRAGRHSCEGPKFSIPK